MPRRTLLIFLFTAVLAGAGCNKHYVQAAPPSVSSPPPEPAPPVATPLPLPTAEVEPLPPEESPAAEPEPGPAARPSVARSRPAPPEAAAPAPARPAAPQISPQLSPSVLAAAQSRTNSDIEFSEQTLQAWSARALNAAQKDLAEKIRSFLAQAREAIGADDWIRAQNLAQKARVLSDELLKSR